MKQLRFFAAEDDLQQVLAAVEEAIPLQYISTDSGNLVEPVLSHVKLPHIGVATNESAVNSESFLVARQATVIRPRAIRQIDGTIYYAIDQLENPSAVTLTPGGVWNNDIVLYGTVGAVSENEETKALLRAFDRAIKKTFVKVKAFWVGPRAMAMLRMGKRLTIAAQSPKDFDLSLS